MTNTETHTRPFYCQVTLSVAEWGMLRTTRKYFETADEALISAAQYAQGRFDREQAYGNSPESVGPAMSTLGSERSVTADRNGGALHRNVWSITTGTL